MEVIKKPKIPSSSDVYHAVGKRKTAIVKVWLEKSDTHSFTINGIDIKNFFGARDLYYLKFKTPFIVCGLDISNYSIRSASIGGGIAGCSDALRLAISKAILLMDSSLGHYLKTAKLLTRDSRVVESKKYGLRKARKREQYSKR